jgi:hypothetical protein
MKPLIFLFLWAAATIAVPAAAMESGEPASDRFALVLIDGDSLACSPCLSALEALCRAVPRDIQAERMIGVLTFRPVPAADSRRARIVRTKWTGYSRTGGLNFQATVDEGHVFNGLNGAGTTVFLFHPSGYGFKRLTPPFTAPVLEEIVRFLLVGKSPIMGETS